MLVYDQGADLQEVAKSVINIWMKTMKLMMPV